MPGRFVQTLTARDSAARFGAALSDGLPDVPRYNICPTQEVMAVVSDDGVRRLISMRWGFVPAWAKGLSDGPLMINARADTIAEKPAYREACRQRRCIVVASGFYEWTPESDGGKAPWYVYPRNRDVVAFAGIWQDWGPPEARVTTCAIVTTEANAALSVLHDRMGVTLAPEDYAMWLGEAGKGAFYLMKPAPEDRFGYYRVGREVNSNRAAGARLIEPLDG
ncbi:SOS response-associated peptidase [Actibacterium sp. 188UL27-1]|uniref:SOS response-associated peptidase n=1 Tax=Actibacterium sp. 188UL27-1 TaxID=2786961 RepID=UPI001956C13D|nr:SOS response-associated peptidase [Actibacterium sp. 188UL27-1]MBM7068254.1 SOS response-associated peptidase [Actibacterium sp. 188UL27-1]